MDSAPKDQNHPPLPVDLSNHTLGEFRLVRRLGSGGMADVYLAEQTTLSRSVAVKILQEDAVSGKNNVLRKRFEQEARAAGGLSHPNIVQVFMIGEQNGTHYIVQEYVQGQNLSQWIKRNGPPEFLEGLKWMKQIASALSAAAEAGIVHRDIKPENIMLTRSGDAKVTDFGLAQLNQQNEQMNLTQAGTTMGTPWYMSPEQIQGEKLDHRNDQYSFGVTCYHMFAGRPPFPGKNSVSVAVQHLKEEPQPLSVHRQDLPRAMCDTIHRMMSKKPEDRFQSPHELEAALALLENAPLNPALADPGLLSRIRSQLPSGRSALIASLLAVIVGMGIGHRIFRRVRLPEVQNSDFFDPQENAVRQFAVAMINDNVTAWETVFRRFPDAPEANIARLQLAYRYLKMKEYSRADALLKELYTLASIKSDANRNIRILALVARAYSANKQGKLDVEQTIKDVQLNEFKPVDQITDALQDAPQFLFEYWTGQVELAEFQVP